MSRFVHDTILSIDAESNGLGGLAFVVGISVSDRHGPLESAVFRCPITGRVNDWVAKHVLPVIKDIEVDCTDHWDMVGKARERFFRPEQKTERSVIAHVPWPVESTLLGHMLPGELVWQGPYPLIDVASVLLARGFNPLSVDDYLREHGIEPPPGSAHHPLYDARSADRCLRHLMRSDHD